MGNIIVMAVRHRDLDRVATLDFKEIIRSPMHQADILPKEFDGSQRWVRSTNQAYETATPNVVFSNYYHSSGSPRFYVDDRFFVSAGVLGQTLSNNDAGPALDFSSKLSQIRQILRHKKTRILKGKVSRELRQPGEAVSLFMVYTDTMDRVENNPHTMEDVVHYCRTGETNPRTFGSLNKGIATVGTIDGDSAGIFMVSDYSGKIITLPRFDLTISEDERQAILAAPMTYLDVNGFDITLLRELAACFGYQLVTSV